MLVIGNSAGITDIDFREEVDGSGRQCLCQIGFSATDGTTCDVVDKILRQNILIPDRGGDRRGCKQSTDADQLDLKTTHLD